MITTKAAYLTAGIVAGLCFAAGTGSQDMARATPGIERAVAPTATVALSGSHGRYLQFQGRQKRAGTFAGNLSFRRPVSDGRYTLSLTFKDPAQGRIRLVYDIDVRRR